MATLQSTQSFTTGQVLTASALTNHVVDATPLPDFIGARSNLTTGIEGQDEILINDISAGSVKKVSVTNLAAGLPSGTTAVDFSTTGTATIGTNLTVNGNTTLGDASTDTATVNAAMTVGGIAAFNNNSTIGTAAVTGLYSRTTTTLTVTSNGHGLSNGNTRWFVIENNTALSGSYAVSSVTTNTFVITVADSGATSGNISWYERTATVQSTLAGTIQGDIAVQTKTIEQGSGDEFLAKDSSDSNKLRSVSGAIVRAWGNIDAAFTTVSGTLSRSGSTTATITTGSSHNFRVNDVVWLSTVGTFSAGWYAVATVPSSTTFTVVTASTSSASGTVNWYQHSLLGSNNVYSAYGRNDQRCIAVNFTNKPAAANDYIVTFAAAKFTSGNQFITPQINNIGSSLSASLMKTVNNFMFYSGTTAGDNTSTTGEFHFQAIW